MQPNVTVSKIGLFRLPKRVDRSGDKNIFSRRHYGYFQPAATKPRSFQSVSALSLGYILRQADTVDQT